MPDHRRTAPNASISWLFKAYRAKLERFLARRAHRPQEASDLAQEIYLRLLRFPPERILEKPHAYLYRIASNVVHDFNTHRRDEAVTFDSEVAEEFAESAADIWSGGPAEGVMAEQELQRILLKLPRNQLAALLLHKRDGMTVPEIARHLNVPVDTVKSRIAYALAACRAGRREL